MDNNLSLEQLEEYIKNGEVLQVRISDKLSNLENQYKQVAEELIKLGINPQTAMADIQQKEKEYNDGLQKLASMIPIDVINSYKNYNFADTMTAPQTAQKPF